MPAVAHPPEDDAWLHRVARWDDREADAKIREGLSMNLALHLQQLLDLTDEEAARLIGRSRSTFARYRDRGKALGVPEAERLVRYTRLLARAAQTFGSTSEARTWMREPNHALGGSTPLELAQTDPGAALVRDALTGLQRGFPL